MGVLRQFGALLWKNYVLRKRKPIFLLLEVLWPVIIFVVIALVRRGVPPVPSESCYYQERALPSAGMLPFLQTAVCTLNNPCLSQETVEQKAVAQERLRSMLYKVEPYLRKNTTLEAFEVLPTIAKVFHTLKTKLNDTVLEEFGDRLVLKNLLRDEEKIVDMLVEEYKLMTEQQARDLLDSSLNPYELINAISNIDFKDVACDKTKLTKYVFFPKRTDVAAVSQSLCDIDDELISNITNEVVRQIDIANLIRFGEEFAKFMGEFDYAVLFHDIADLMEVYIDKSGLLAAITDLPDLTMIPKVFDKLAEIIPAFEKLGGIDMENIWSLYDLFYPFMESFVSDDPTRDMLRQTADSLKEWTTSLNTNSNVSDIDIKKMVNVTAALSEVFNSMGDMSYISDILDSMNFNSMYEMLENILNTYDYKWDDALLAEMAGMNSASMAGLENLVRSMLSNSTVNMMMEVSYKVTEMLMDTMDSYAAMDSELRYFVTIDKDVMNGNVLNILAQMGPEMTSAFATEILKPNNYESLILGEVDAQSLCENVTYKIYGEKERAMADYWKTYLCSSQIVDKFEQLRLGSIYQENMVKMEKSMEYISYVIENPDSITNPVNMSTVYTKISQMSNQTTHIFIDNTKQWTEILTDLPYEQFGTYDEAGWYFAWTNASSAMFMTDMMLSIKQMGESMQGTELWSYMMPSAIAMEAYMAAQAEPYRLMQDMMDASTPLGMLVENMEYIPDILPAMMTFMNSEEGQKEMEVFYTDPLKAICEDGFLRRMNMPATVPVGDIERSICDSDWEKFGQELMETMDWMGTMQKKIDILNYNGTTSTVDWDRVMENMNIYMTAMNSPDQVAKDFEYLMNKMNVTKLLENLGKMDQNGMQNVTMDEVNSTISAMVSAMEGLDKSLVNVSFWSYGKHVARLWMAYTNIANDVYLHTKDGINITDYIKTMSPTLGDYVMNISSKFPSLFDELIKSLQNPQMILSATFNTDWEKLCNGTKISVILQLRATEGIEEFERGLCKLNWTAVMEEIIDYNPNIKIYNDELSILAGSIDKAPRTTVNWTELAEGTMEMIENLQDWFTSNSSQQVQGIDTNSLNMTLDDFIKTLTQVDQWDATKFGGIAQELTNLLYNQEDMGGNSSIWSIMIQSNMLQLYISYHFLKFANLQLHYVNTTNPVDLKMYLNSEEADKVFHAMSVSNEVNAALFANLKDYATNPQKMTDLLSSNLSAVCEDETAFGKLFSLPPESNLTMRDLQDTVCGVNLNITKLVSELEKSVPGFKDMLDAMSKIETMAAEGLQKEDYVNITQYTAENERFSKLLESILTNPPNITVFWANPNDDMSWLIKQLEDFANFTTSGFGDQQITTTFGTVQQHLGEALSGLAQSSPEIGRIMYIADAYLKMLELSLIKNRSGLWEDPRASLAGYPEMMKVWDLMEKLPELYETFQYTLAYDNKKISTFVGLLIESFDKLCAADPSTLMTVPPNSNFSFSQFMSELCDVNVTVLTTESNEYNGGQIVMDAYATIDNITQPANITEMFQRLDELYGTLVDMSNNTDITEMELPRFLNMKIWEDIFSRSEQVLGNSTMNIVNETSIVNQIMDSIDELQTSMPDIRPYLNVLDLYLSVYLHNTQQQLDIRQDPLNAFLDFPEMRKLWLLMDELPELYQTYTYTSLMNPDKISNFTATLISGFEALCTADPADLMTVPPDLNFDFANFHQKLCAVNLTILGEESMRYNSQDNITRAYENFNNLTNLVNLNDMAKKISDLAEMTQEVYNFNMSSGGELPRFLNFTLWEGIMATVSNWTMDPEILAHLATNSQSLISMLSGMTMTEEDKVMMRTMEAFNMLFETILDKMEAKKGTNETLQIEDFFTSSTELLKLIKLLQKPGMMEILVYASNNPQVSTILTNPNTTDAIDDLCAKDWVTFLNLPGKAGVNFTALQEEICALNFTAFMPELYKEFGLQEIMDKISSNDTVDWRFISEQNQKLSERFTNFLATPPEFELPAHWTNETMWSELFTTYSEAMSNLTTLAGRVGSTVGNSDSLLSSLSEMGLSDMEASMLRSMEVVNMFVGTLLDKLEAKNGTDVSYKLEDFFTSSVEVLKLVHLLQRPGMMEILLYSSNNPQFSAIYMNEDTTAIIDDLCALNWEEVLRLPEKKGVNYTALQEEFCAVNFSAILPELYEEFNMQAIIDKMSSNDSVDWQYITQQNERLNERINKLVTSPPKFDLPAHWTNDTMWHNLFTTYSEFLNNMNQLPDSATLVDQVFSPLNNEAINKMGAIADILMDNMIKQLEEYPDEINLDYLLNNNTELRTLVDVLAALSYTGADDFSNGNIDVSKLLGLILEPSKLEEACKDGSFLNMISKYNITETVLNIEKIVCMDTEAVSQALMNFQDNADVQDKIAKILNSSEPVTVDWKIVGSKVDSLIKLMTDQFSRNITMSVGLMELFNINNTLPILESLLTDPSIIGQMTGVLRPWVDKDMIDIIHPVLAQMLDMMNMLQEKNVTLQSLMTDQDMLNDVIASLNTFDTQMGSYIENAVKPAIDLAATKPSVQEAVCYVPTLEGKAQTVPTMGVDVNKVSQALCGKAPTEWFDRLLDAGFTQTQMIGVKALLESLYIPITDPTDRMWAGFTDTVKHLIMAAQKQVETEMEFTPHGTPGEPGMPQEFDFNSFMNETLNGFISYMKIVDSDETVQDSLHELKQFFTSVTSMQNYVNEQLEKGRESGKGLNVTGLLPDPELVAKMINGMQGKEYTDIITLMSLYPEKFLIIYKNGQWEEVACNPTKFYEEFQVEEGFDAEGIRKSMCDAVTTNTSVFSEILNNIQMADFINELSSWLTGGGTLPVNSNVWDELLRTSNQFLKNIADLQNIDVDGLIAYGEALLKYLGELATPTTSTSSYTAQCESTLQQFYGTEFYDTTILPVLNSVYTQTYLQYEYQVLAEEMFEVMCEEPASNMTRLVDLLKMSDVPEKLKQIAEQTTETMTFSCEGMVNISLMYAEVMNRSFTAWAEMDKHAECLEGQMKMMLEVLGDVTELFEVGKVMLRELNNKDFREFMTTIAGSEDILEVMEYILQGFVQQQNWIEETNDKIQSNITELESYLEDALRLSPNVLQSLVNATLQKDMGNLTAEDVVNALCADSSADPTNEFLAYFNSSLRDAIGLDCDEDRNITYDVVNTLLTLSKLTERLQTNIDTDNIGWWLELGQDFSELASGIQGLSELTSLIDNINDIDIENIAENGELLVTIQRLLIDSGPESLIDNLNNILDKFGEMNDDSQEIFKDIQILTRGMLSFTTLRRLIISNVQIKDLLKDPDHFQQYLIDSIDIPEDVARAIVDGSLSFELLINASQANLTDWICEPDKLADILNISSSRIDHKFIGETFCNLDTDKIATILEEVFKQLDIGDLVEEFLTTSIDDILKEAGTSKKDVEHALDSLQNANADLKEIIDEFGDYAANMTDVIAALAQAQIGTASPSSLSELICGESMGDIDDEFSLGDSLPSSDTLTDEQKEEMEELKAENEVCEKLYLDIMSTSGGPIIWGYLKPIMRGKILFSPNNDITKSIIEKINATFATIADFQKDASKLASGATSLDNITSGDTDIVKLLSSPLVESFITQFSSSGSGFEDLVYTLNDSSSDLVSAMSNAASFMGDYIHCIELDRFEGYDSEADLEQQAAKLAGKNNLLAGIVFTNADQGNVRRKRDSHADMPSHLMYKIRMDIDNVEQTQSMKSIIWRPVARDDFADDLRYLRGFIQLQDMVDSAFIETTTGTEGTKVQAISKQIPFPCHKRDTFLNALVAYLLPVMMTFAWLASLALATYNLVLDRESGQEETLRAMGLVCCINWWAWFISTIFIMAVVSVILTIISHYAELMPFSNFAIIFLYFLDFCFSTTMLCYFVSAFFTRASIAILVTLIVYFLSYLPYMVLLTLNIQMTFWQKSLACLSSTSAFGFAAEYLAMYEEQQIGLHWDNIGTSQISGDSASFSWCCIMMVIDGGIYLILGWYVRSVKPGKYGVSEPWWFPVCPSYWSSCCGGLSGSQDKYRAAEQGEQFETDMSRSPKVISVRGLSKEYRKGKPVVTDLNMDVYAGQVTTLLGHNGAAKTTTMNMLTGLLEPTAGDVAIFNRPLRNMKKSIGVCPQHNSLYKYMTVKEHMEFVQSVKSGASDASSKEEIRQILEEVNLWHCRHSNVQELSGGMQRRLCVALAFVGNSKAVILDEPTSGVDPSGRRAIWNLIIRKKGAIGVLLSTHHLDEAEVISDKVCVLHEGKLLCSGTPLFLKEKFSSGHRMTVETVATTGTEHSAVTMCIQHYVPSAVLKSSVANEMKFVLPTSNRTNFYDLFRTLEERREELQIASFGVSDPTLEEVFLTVCKTTDILDMDRGESNEIVDLAQPLLESRYNTGSSWKFQQFGALFVKRFHHYRRNWRLFLSAILLPVLLFLAASGLHTVRPDATQRSLLLSPAIYGPDTYFFVNDHSQGQDAMSIYDTLMHNPGIATSCMDNMGQYRNEYSLECVDPATSYTTPDYTMNPNATCSCNDYKYTCTEGSATAPPRQRMTTTGDILQNLEGRNTENYLFESFHEFIQNRYGGYSFEDDSDPSGTEPSLKSTVWFNNKGFHTLPSFYSGLSNAVLRSRAQSMKNGDPKKYGITTFNHPFTFNTRQLSKDTILQSAADLGIAATIMLAFTFIPVGIVMYSVNEFINKEKHLQFTSGIGPALYWFTSFFWDLIILVVTTALVFAVMAIFRHDAFWARHNAAGAVVLILLYGWATLPLVYCTTKLFNSASTAFLTMFCLLNFIGLVPICAVFVLNFYQHIEIIYDAYIVCQKVFLIFPTYALGAGLIDIMTNQIKTSIFERFGTDVYVDPFTFDLIGWNYVALGIEGLVFFIFAVLLDTCASCKCDCASVNVESDRYDDNDVQQEMTRLAHRGNNENSLVARNVSKVYKRAGSNFLAVDHVTFGVSRGECFGLLGVNGAGKTTTFKIITGSLNATQGSIFLSPNGYQRDTKIWQNIGYCPQEEALDSFLTVEEMLEFFGKMRGLDGQTRKIAIRNVTDNLKLQPILKKTVRTCSGGMKRKLSLAIALLGDPAFVLLDEPTTGMDPVAKRLAWNCIKTAKSKGQTILLTSHSMEECDILCSRLSIMVNGQMKCLGSPQHLKDKFGDTYTIMLHVCGPLARTGKIYELVQAYFPGASIRDHHLDVIQLDIPKTTTSVSEIFRVLEKEKENYNILYYTVSQNTLETIFLNFAREQHDSESEGTGSSDRSSDLTMPVDEESKLAGKLLPQTRYGYMNKAYEGFGEYPVPPTQKMADPTMVTLETNSFYNTKL